MEKYKIGVVGLGYWGPNLLRNFRTLPDTEVKWICDTKTDRLVHMKQLYPEVNMTTEYRELIEDRELDAIAIATPVSSHYPLAMQAIEAGRHVFIEKPMAASVSEAVAMIEAAAKRSLTLMVGHTFLYSAPVRTIKEIIESGEIGEVMYISSRRLNLGLFQKDINVAWDLAPHDISIILYLLGEDPESVNCQGKAHLSPGIEDVTNMSLNFPNGSFAVIQSSWIDPKKVREIVIVGTKKMIVYDDTEPNEKIKIYDKRVEVPPHYDTFAEFTYSYHYGDVHGPFIKQTEPLKIECQHFVDCIRSGEKSISCGEEGLKVVQVLEASTTSLRNGGIKVPLQTVSEILKV
jgi:predicted dehydrogenase